MSPRIRRSLALAMTLAGGSVALAACSDAGANPSTAASSSIVPLVVYSAQGYDKVETQAFQQATGIPVSLDDDSTGPLVTKIEAEKNNPKWGLLWVDGATVFASLDQQGMLVKNWEPSVSWDSTGQQSVPKDGSYIPTGLTMACAIVYDSSKISNPPNTWNDLLKPEFDHKVGMNDPSISGPTYPCVAGVMNAMGGVNQGENFLTKLQSNGLDVHETNGDTLQALEVGQISIAMIQSSAEIGAIVKGNSNFKVVYPDPVTALPSAIGIDAKAPKAEIAEAKKFVEFVLSSQGQRVMQSGDPHGDSLYWPVIDGVSPLPALPPLSSLPVQTIDPYTWGARQGSIDTWFTNNIA
jgi:iron(III) transport system substrate-binding protein